MIFALLIISSFGLIIELLLIIFDVLRKALGLGELCNF